ncbi:MAG: peptidylprolyl isomerase [Ramlibacter sp.]|nr:peptidylprolyl isomerase [Ramlibacter sp.]
MRRRDVLAVPLTAMAGALAFPASAAAQVMVRVEGAFGAFVIAVDPAVAPVTVANFLAYVDGKHLDNASIYRIVTMANQVPETVHKIEVVQWGANLAEDAKPPFAAIAHETTRDTGLLHRDGTVSMARAEPGSASGEFFICVGDQPALDFGGGRNPDGMGFAAFGQVVQGMDVVRKIHSMGQAKQFLAEPIAIRTVRRT